jgi:hypothetical protein
MSDLQRRPTEVAPGELTMDLTIAQVADPIVQAPSLCKTKWLVASTGNQRLGTLSQDGHGVDLLADRTHHNNEWSQG